VRSVVSTHNGFAAHRLEGIELGSAAFRDIVTGGTALL